MFLEASVVRKVMTARVADEHATSGHVTQQVRVQSLGLLEPRTCRQSATMLHMVKLPTYYFYLMLQPVQQSEQTEFSSAKSQLHTIYCLVVNKYTDHIDCMRTASGGNVSVCVDSKFLVF